MKTIRVDLTKSQADSLCSLAEMTSARVAITFKAWADINPRRVPGLERAVEEIDRAIEASKRRRAKR